MTKPKRDSAADLLPRGKIAVGAAELPTGEAFRPEWIDFEHGIRVGNIEPHERITQILKFHLETRYGTPFVTDRWGRGVYWQWICWMPRANRLAKTVSRKVNFGCAKLFISADGDRKVFKSGFQVERGYVSGPEAGKPWGLREDFDWHRLLKQCRAGTAFDRELRRLVGRELREATLMSTRLGALYGEEIGAHLVTHPGVSFVVFTGSRAVGLAINLWGALAF